MCGVAGIYRQRGLTVQDKAVLGRMSMVLRHRGPDAEGCWSDEHVALVHRRLSIIDLSPEANQPLTSLDRQVSISFNGEIYNFQEVRRELESLGHRFRDDRRACAARMCAVTVDVVDVDEHARRCQLVACRRARPKVGQAETDHHHASG